MSCRLVDNVGDILHCMIGIFINIFFGGVFSHFFSYSSFGI